jgi:hypothetical protein
MGDECTCEKCQTVSVSEQGASMWPVVKAETQTENRGRSQPHLYLVVTDGGISLHQQSYEL